MAETMLDHIIYFSLARLMDRLLVLKPSPSSSAGDCENSSIIPAGVNVSPHSSVMTRDRNVNGQDAEAFRPERWLPRFVEGRA